MGQQVGRVFPAQCVFYGLGLQNRAVTRSLVEKWIPDPYQSTLLSKCIWQMVFVLHHVNIRACSSRFVLDKCASGLAWVSMLPSSSGMLDLECFFWLTYVNGF